MSLLKMFFTFFYYKNRRRFLSQFFKAPRGDFDLCQIRGVKKILKIFINFENRVHD